MAYMIVLLAAFVAGGLTYWLTLRSPGTEPGTLTHDEGFLPATPSPSAAAGGDAYVPLGSDRRSWQTRVVGMLGLLISITLAAALLAFVVYESGSMLVRLISDYATK